MFYMSQVAKTMPIELTTFDDHFLTLVVSMGSICNGLFRIMWGILQDKFSFKSVFVFVVAIQLFTMLFITTAVKQSQGVYLATVMLGYGGLSANFIVIPTLVFKMFGLKAGG